MSSISLEPEYFSIPSRGQASRLQDGVPELLAILAMDFSPARRLNELAGRD
jgi:hypothetical protein